VSCQRAQQVDIATLLGRQDSAETLEFLRHCDECEVCAEAVREQARPAVESAASVTRLPVILASVVVVLLLILLLGSRLLGGGSASDEQSSSSLRMTERPAEMARTQPVPTSVAEPGRASEPQGVLVLRSGETLEIDSAALPAGGRVRLQLTLPVASTSDEPRPVRILVEGREPLETLGEHRAGDRKSASLEIDADWLRPGHYIVEVKTTELTHLPLRRYALDVR
jgi:hypothetical protein